jgi:hypothetical protein
MYRVCYLSRNMLNRKGLRYTDGCRLGEHQELISKALFHAKNVVSVHESLAGYVQRLSSSMHTSSRCWRFGSCRSV